MNIRKRLPLFGTWGMLAALTLSACGGRHNGGAGNTSSTTPVVPAALVSIAVTPVTATVATGATQQFTATGMYTRTA